MEQTEDAKITKSLEGNFDDVSELNISSRERQILSDLRSASDKNGYEYGTILNEKGESLGLITSNEHNSVRLPIDEAIKTGNVRIYHSHTNDTPLSSEDLFKLTEEKVESVAVTTANGDVFIVKRGNGYIPSKTEFDEFEKEAYNTSMEYAMNYPDFREMSSSEANYVAIREQFGLIVRHFEWSAEGGKL